MRKTIATLAAPATLDATTNSDAVDVSQFHGLVDFVLTSTATGGEGQTSTVKIQHSDDGSTGWADTGVAFDAVDDAEGSVQSVRVSVDQLKKYVRVVTTLDGTDPTVGTGVLLIGSRNDA